MIEITLILNKKELDLVVPNKVTMGRLKELLHETLGENGIDIAEDFRLRIKDKQVTVGAFDMAFDFGLASGDRLEIELGEKNADI